MSAPDYTRAKKLTGLWDLFTYETPFEMTLDHTTKKLKLTFPSKPDHPHHNVEFDIVNAEQTELLASRKLEKGVEELEMQNKIVLFRLDQPEGIIAEGRTRERPWECEIRLGKMFQIRSVSY